MQVRKKEDQCLGSIWDCLPVCEKEKDEINFAGLNAEVCLTFFNGILFEVLKFSRLRLTSFLDCLSSGARTAYHYAMRKWSGNLVGQSLDFFLKLIYCQMIKMNW